VGAGVREAGVVAAAIYRADGNAGGIPGGVAERGAALIAGGADNEGAFAPHLVVEALFGLGVSATAQTEIDHLAVGGLDEPADAGHDIGRGAATRAEHACVVETGV